MQKHITSYIYSLTLITLGVILILIKYPSLGFGLISIVVSSFTVTYYGKKYKPELVTNYETTNTEK